jgi:hypothetical protein
VSFFSKFFGFLQFFFRHFTCDNFLLANGNSSTDSRTLFMEEHAAPAPCLYNTLGLMKECSVSKMLVKICYNFPALVRESLCYLHLGMFSYHPAQHKSHAFPERCKAITFTELHERFTICHSLTLVAVAAILNDAKNKINLHWTKPLQNLPDNNQVQNEGLD